VLQQQQGSPPLLHEVNPDVPPTLSAAVGIALAIHPRGRYESAKAMGDALDAAARGIAPPTSLVGGATEEWDTAATSVLGPSTEATRAVRRTGPVAAREPVAARRARPATGPQRVAAAPAERRRSPWRGIIIALIVLLALAGVGIAVASSVGGEKQVQLREVVRDNVNDSVDEMKQLVEDNTR